MPMAGCLPVTFCLPLFLFFRTIPFVSPPFFPMFHPFIYQNPQTATLAFLTTFKTLFPFAFTLFHSYDSVS